MKTLKTLLVAFITLFALNTNAQSVDEIIDNYFENTGGKANWEKLQGFKMKGKANAQGMEIPVEIVQMKDGKMYVQIDFQGKVIKQIAFDGEKLWSTNFMTQKAEESDKETTENFKKSDIKDFPSPFLNYKEKGYTVELLGKETKEGTECFKVKLTKTPIMVDGKEEENATTYYFDTENFVPIAADSVLNQGPQKGLVVTETMSDYEEVDGLYFPFSMSQFGSPITFDSIETNPKIDDAEFKMPVVEETPATGN